MNRTPSHSLYMKTSHNSNQHSQHKFVTPEKLVRISGSSGVKCNSISKNGARIRSEAIETVNKAKEHQKLQECMFDLENKLLKQKEDEQQQLEIRILKLLHQNHEQEDQMLLLQQENESLKQLVYEQQAKILEQNQELMSLRLSKEGMKKYSFSDYFKQQNL